MKTIQSKFICITFLSWLAISGCKIAGTNESPANSTANSTASSAANSATSNAFSKETAASSDSKDGLFSSMKNMQNAKFWVADVDVSGDSMPQSNVKMNIKYAAPDSFQMENNMAGNKMQIIAVGGKTYMQIDGKWRQAPSGINMGEMMTKWKDMFDENRFKSFKNVQSAGKETLNGKEMAVYTCEIEQDQAMPEAMKKEMSDEAKARLNEIKAQNSAKIWVDEEKNLPARLEMTVKTTQPKETTGKINVDYKFDEEVKIVAPKLN